MAFLKAFVTKWEGVWNGEFWGQQAMGCRMRSWLCRSKLLMSLMGLTRAWWVFLDAREFAVLISPYQETISQWVTQTPERPEPAEVAAWS